MLSTTQETPPVEKMAFRINEAAHAVGLSRTKIYTALAAGRLRSVKIEGRRLILREDLAAFVRQQAAS